MVILGLPVSDHLIRMTDDQLRAEILTAWEEMRLWDHICASALLFRRSAPQSTQSDDDKDRAEFCAEMGMTESELRAWENPPQSGAHGGRL